MTEKSVFEQIKKQNGERFAKAIRAYDNGIFEVPDIVNIVKYAGHEAEPIMAYLESLKAVQIERQGAFKDPITLLNEAGYDAYYADTFEKQNAIEKYYAPGEELCTFRDPTRYQRFYIINAVRKDVDKIKREDFRGKEKREDKYGTSVLSIQILKNGGFISIKNRYNHAVQNPDNTLGSNPDNIIKGLSDSISHYFNVDFSSKRTSVPDDFILLNNKPVRFNCEIEGIFIGDNFYVKDGLVFLVDTDKEILMDYFVFNLKDKTIRDVANTEDPFSQIFMQEIKDKKIRVIKDQENILHIYVIDPTKKTKNFEIAAIQNHTIVSLNLPTTTKIENNFLQYNQNMVNLHAPVLNEVGNCFLVENKVLEKIDAPILQKAGDNFLKWDKLLFELDLPLLQQVGASFLRYNSELKNLHTPCLETVGDAFLYYNHHLTEVDFPLLTSVGTGFMYSNQSLQKLNAPLLSVISPLFAFVNRKFKTNAPALIPMLPPSRILKAPIEESLQKVLRSLLKNAPQRHRN